MLLECRSTLQFEMLQGAFFRSLLFYMHIVMKARILQRNSLKPKSFDFTFAHKQRLESFCTALVQASCLAKLKFSQIKTQ